MRRRNPLTTQNTIQREIASNKRPQYPIEYTQQKSISHAPQQQQQHVPQQAISHIPQQVISHKQYPHHTPQEVLQDVIQRNRIENMETDYQSPALQHTQKNN